MKKAPPPKAPPPLSSDEMAIIKKKVAPPKGPPPAGLASFKAPKKYDENDENDYQRSRDDSDDINNNNNNNNNHYNHNNNKSRYQNELDDDDYDDNNNNNNGGGHMNHNNNNNNYNNYNDDDENEYLNHKSDSKQYSHRNNNDNNYSNNNNNNNNNNNKRRSRGGDDNEYVNNEYSGNYSQSKGKRDYNYNEDNDNDNDNYDNNNNNKSIHNNNNNNDNNKFMSKNRDQSTSENKSLPPLDPYPNKPRVFNFRKILRASFKDLRLFVTTPCEPNTIIRCYIERSRGGSNFLTPIYSLCADLEDGTGRELIACRKMLKSKTSYYVFSLKSEDLYRKREQRGKYYLGKLRALSDNRYVLYDNGVCDTIRSTDNQNDTVDDISIDGDGQNDEETSNSPQRRQLQLHQQHHDDENSLYRSQLAIIHFNSKVRPVNEGERGMEICIPNIGNGSESVLKHIDMIPNFDKIQLVGKQNELFSNKYTILHEKRSRYDPLSSCLVDFQGRATVASVKNFQLIISTPMIDHPVARNRGPTIAWATSDNNTEEDVIFQMGKITGECFNMDFKSPLTMLQAFAIAISRFDANLTW